MNELVSKHRPQRMCVACRKRADKHTLVRIVRLSDGRVDLDQRYTSNGRGAYLCRSVSCWHLALKRRSLEKAFRLNSLHPDDRSRFMHYVHCLEQT